MINLTTEQRAVEAQIDAFIRDPRPAKPWFCYTGAAGTGKTQLLAHIARKYPGARLCAFTGKAASVIARKSGLHAQTIHSALYQFYGRDEETEELKFGRKVEAGAWTGHLVLIDEASTVNEWLADDLLATGCKVVASGDPNQLGPVKGVAFFTQGIPDAKLIEVHRQAWGSPIIRQAHMIISGHGYHNDGPDFQVKVNIDRDELLAAEVVLCWLNDTRVMLNRLMRAHRGFAGIGRRGEPVMALRNNPRWGLLNGAVYTLLEDHINGSGRIAIVNERGKATVVEKAWIEDMEAPIESMGLKNDTAPFAWGYVCTVHKAQGSEWERVILVDEYDRADRRDNWLYTGVTRASKSIIVQRSW